MTADELQPLSEDWARALAVIAHPDDMEYGAASAIAKWTNQNKTVSYLLVSRGEAGIRTVDPEIAGPIREREQRAACAAIGVDDITFLSHDDGKIEPGLPLRRDIARSIRAIRPEVLLGLNHRDSWGGSSWNHADHRIVGRSLLDAARDAANPWRFPDAGEPWTGVRFAAFFASPESRHGVDVTGHLGRGLASLRCHELYLATLADEGGDDPAEMLARAAAQDGRRLGVADAVSCEIIYL